MRLIHLAGTNGKGSTAQYIAEILWQSKSCGLFTSPHIMSPCERMVINGEQISQGAYDSYMKTALDGREPGGVWTMFGVWFEAAMAWFKDRGVEYAVIETGLGGKKDQTNVIDSEMQIITPISFDHTQYLGNTITKIAREKCGIIKWGSTVITHPQLSEAMEVIKRTVDRMDCRLLVLDESAIKVRNADTEGQLFSFRHGEIFLDGVHINAVSPVQVQNAAVAAMAAHELGVAAEDIKAGLEQARLTARVQYNGSVLIDSSHNPSAIAELSNTVKKYFGKKHIVALTAIMEDKDVRAVADGIAGFADTVICTCADKKRGVPAKEYAKYFDSAFAMENPAYAFEYARELAEQKRGMTVVCGSFYLAPYALGAKS